MEENVTTAPEEARPLTAADVERQLAALAQTLMAQMEKNAQADTSRQEQMDAREQDLARRELAAKARRLLMEKELPEDLADSLFFENEAAMAQAIDALEIAFRAAVQQAVEERLSDSAPKAGALVPLDQLTDEEYYAAVCRND
ncbi:MAG: DUF4355 domain-containing protein [Clostridia bacterium]|nr:DUF4355 domain-containing protein [Clostridia bacterium]